MERDTKIGIAIGVILACVMSLKSNGDILSGFAFYFFKSTISINCLFPSSFIFPSATPDMIFSNNLFFDSSVSICFCICVIVPRREWTFSSVFSNADLNSSRSLTVSKS